jgi:hypothetical protein
MATSKSVYQLKITLAHIQPAVWRGVEVKDCSLSKLSDVIQAVMGWEGYHMWSFEIGGEEYGEDPTGELELANAKKAKLSGVVASGIKKFRYVYDFGDDWEHLIEVEKVLDAEPKVKYPRCVAGARACPPEDIGGPWGYASFCDAIKNPKHEDHDEMLEWIGGNFDPEVFEIDSVNQELAQAL